MDVLMSVLAMFVVLVPIVPVWLAFGLWNWKAKGAAWKAAKWVLIACDAALVVLVVGFFVAMAIYGWR